MKGVRKVHMSYVENPTDSWVVADGGRCYKEAELRQKFVEMVRCPSCSKERWFRNDAAYRQHWQVVHQDG